MKNIKILDLAKYQNKEEYELVEKGIYKCLNPKISEFEYRIALSFELEDCDDEDGQYPMEDILENYLLYVSDFLETENDDKHIIKNELAGDLEGVRQAALMVGKRVYNKSMKGKDGRTYVDFIVE
ncbi:hypothetical protein FACS189476_00640 [Spirochaetia bacterium]|nr:hypothetical protein FACS189476_00640 [Spirochaetia bacterium]